MPVGSTTNGDYGERHNNNSFSVSRYAVLVKQVEYCHLRSKQKVLDGLSMKVSQGSIYGLIGSSGCGKTTLISCILGTRSVNNGEIYLYGCNNTHPNMRNIIEIPGRGVGFMPQELSLYSKFTIHEILQYFGRLHGMTTFEIRQASQTLLDLLQLSQKSKSIELLSGGEQRRVSFAVSLIHSPKLLVLDEPTAGMDALLRLRIWNYLRDIVKDRQVTVIITTHYLDEMRNADKIGIMRNGQIIAENSPQNLISLCKGSSLDDAVLNLCKNADIIATQNRRLSADEDEFEYRDPGIISAHEEYKEQLSNLRESILRTRAVIGKNIYLLLRNLPLFLFVMCIPAFQLLIVLLIGYEPTNLRLGVVNEELNQIVSAASGSESSIKSCPEFNQSGLNNTCDLYLLSCRFLTHISKEKISLVNINSEELAISAVTNGNLYGYISFAKNFSTGLVDRALSQNENGTINEDALIKSQIVALFDQSNTILYRLLLNELYQAQEVFLTSLLSACGVNPKLGEYPLQYQTPVFGDANDYSFSNYVSPGASIPFMFFFSIISSGLRFVEERNSGTLERMFISGVKLSEIMLSFLVSEFFQIAVQSSLIFGLLSWRVPMYSVDSLATLFVFLLMILAGYTGVSMGFLVGALCSEQVQVAIIAIAFILPNILLSGIIWPSEAMPNIAQYIVQFLPCTLSSKAVSSIWARGLGITHPNVWPGVIVLLVYIMLVNLITLIYSSNVKK